jgi:hypothetical protein
LDTTRHQPSLLEPDRFIYNRWVMSMATPLRRRRWFQFGLRTMFVMIALVAIPLSWIVKERRQSRYEFQIAEQLRGTGCEGLILGGPYDLWELSLQGKPQAWWRNLARMVLGERIIGVWGLKPESDDPTLLTGLTSFQILNFQTTKATDLTLLPQLRNLRSLHLSNATLKDLTPLVGLTDLQCLLVNSNQVGDLTPLAGLINLKALVLSHTHASDLTPLIGLSDLQSLHICYSKVTDLKPLVMFKKLDWLDLEGTPTQDITPVAEIKSLHYLRVKSTGVSKEQIEALQKALPNCKIDQDPFP